MLLLERGAQPQLADAEGRYSASFSVESSVRKVCVELKIQCVSTNVLLRAAVISYGEFNEEQCPQTHSGWVNLSGLGWEGIFYFSLLIYICKTDSWVHLTNIP